MGLGGGGDGALAGAGGLPSFVPAQFRTPILQAATRWNVSKKSQGKTTSGVPITRDQEATSTVIRRALRQYLELT